MTFAIHARDWLRSQFHGPHILAFVPAIALAAFWLGGEMALLAVAVGLPCLFVSLPQSTEAAVDPLLDEVKRALQEGEIVPWFQPQISTNDGTITGFEALARWQHPTQGLISPAIFLPVIDRSGLSKSLSETILAQSLEALAKWRKLGHCVPFVAVNLSHAELENPALIDKIRWQLDRFDLPASALCIEILESVIVTEKSKMVERNINELINLGCRIDLDDFGTGQASLSILQKFTVHRLKIDRSFVAGVDQKPNQQRLVSAILSMAEHLGLEALAEGVETKGEHARCALLGCDHVQGFGIGRPMPFDDTLAWIDEHLNELQETNLLSKKSV